VRLDYQGLNRAFVIWKTYVDLYIYLLAAIVESSRCWTIYGSNMNWIIHKTKKLRCHTLLAELTKPLQPYLKQYKWVFSDLDFITNHLPYLPINFDQDYFILSADDFQKVADGDVQIIWGVLIAVPENEEIFIDENKWPLVEGNDNIWRNGNMQLKNAEIEIDCFDSSYTIVKFKSEEMSKAFKDYFSEAIELEKFN
jgi:hypothetical protein